MPFKCWLLGHLWLHRGHDRFGFEIITCERCQASYWSLSDTGLGDWVKHRISWATTGATIGIARSLNRLAVALGGAVVNRRW